MRRDSAWRDVMAMLEQLMQEVKDLHASMDKLTAERYPVPVPNRPVRLAKILQFKRHA